MFSLSILPGTYSLHRFGPAESVPAGILSQAFVSVTRTRSELSIVCQEGILQGGEGSWALLEVEGPFPLDALGVIASLSAVLANACVSIFVISTFDTDYILLKQANLSRAVEALRAAGHHVH